MSLTSLSVPPLMAGLYHASVSRISPSAHTHSLAFPPFMVVLTAVWAVASLLCLDTHCLPCLLWASVLRSCAPSHPHRATTPQGAERSPSRHHQPLYGRMVAHGGRVTARLAYSGGDARAARALRRRAGGGSSDGQKGKNPLLNPLTRSFFARFVFDLWKIVYFPQKHIGNP